jgi:hypothetical protein
MPKFSNSDFKGLTLQRLNSIVLIQLGEQIVGSFKDLPPIKQKKYNKILNQYIRELPEEGWDEKIQEDFNDICLEHLFENPKWSPEKIMGLQLSAEITELAKEYTPEQEEEVLLYTEKVKEQQKQEPLGEVWKLISS